MFPEKALKELARMKKAVAVAEEQAVIAQMFHDTWAPMVRDTDLHKRMGRSFATNSFRVIRWALRRELSMALMRLWDSSAGALSAKWIAHRLEDDDVYAALLNDRASRWSSGLPDDARDEVLAEFEQLFGPERAAICALVRSYVDRDGAHHGTFRLLRAVRDERLAHRQIEDRPNAIDPTDAEIMAMYRHSMELVTALLHLVSARTFDLTEAGPYEHHARYFWANVRGERVVDQLASGATPDQDEEPTPA